MIPTVEPTTAIPELQRENPVTVVKPDNTGIMPLRKRQSIRWLAGATGLGLILGCAIAAFHYYRSKPKPWNLNAVLAVEPTTAAVDLSMGLVPNTIPARTVQNGTRPTLDSASVKSEASGKADQNSNASASEETQNANPGLAGIVMAGLRNNTPEDITLPQNVLVMESEQGTHVLHSSKFTLDHDYFIPTGRAVSVTLVADDPCAPENSPEMCVESYFNGVDEIVLFDKPARYEVHIPLKAIQLLRVEPKKQPETRVAVPTGTAPVVRRQHNDTAVVPKQPNGTAVVRQQPNGTAVVRQQPNSAVVVPQQPDSTAVVPQQPQQ
ncbi:MAG: hypothetical protein WAK33_11300 [Silvibacterium sp.]